jgi:hypothetical protein
MLNQISQEVLVLIPGLLTLQDKLRLITTCRHVFNVISNTNLFSELDLLNRTEQVQDILGRFISNQYSGMQVKRLSFDTKKDGFDIPYFIQHIKNAPALRKLILIDCALDLDFLEQIHTSCSLLISLELIGTHIFIKNDTVLAPITPADSLLYLELDSNFIFDPSGLLLVCITTKYRCLKRLNFTFYDEYHGDAFSGYHHVDVDDVFTDSEDERDAEDTDVPEIHGMIFKKK